MSGCGGKLPPSEREWRLARAAAVREQLPPGRRATFVGLRFFPYDRRYCVRSLLQRVQPPTRHVLTTSNGQARLATRVGLVRIVLPEGEGELAVFRLDDVATEHLFLPFRDAAAGTETYAGGRYVDVRLLPGGLVEVDFNRAYNPDCAYGIAASCPVAPAENTLPFSVRAGEMLVPAPHS